MQKNAETAGQRKQTIMMRLFDRTVLEYPKTIVVATLIITAFFGYYVKDFKLDASGDSIVLENDQDLRYYNDTRDIFGSDDYVIITVTPKDDLFTEATLAKLKALRDELTAMESVASCNTILDVPLFQSPHIPLLLIATDYKILEEPGIDRELARKELTESPFYKNHLIAEDGKTTAIQANFTPDPPDYKALYDHRTELRDKRTAKEATAAELAELKAVEAEYTIEHAEQMQERRAEIAELRAVIEKHRDIGTLHIGGVPMIAADIIDYVESDIYTFGFAVLGFVFLALLVLFRSPKWIMVQVITALICVVIMMGYLGWSNWMLTIVTANFSSLLIICSIALTIHLGVHYRELYARTPEKSNRELVYDTVADLGSTSWNTSLTTMFGFGSLYVSGIRPVMDFGVMMFWGILLSHMLCFVFFPAMLMLFPKGRTPDPKYAEPEGTTMEFFARFTENHKWSVALGSIAIGAFCALGTTRLTVENRFIDYFKQTTEIFQGMTEIDERLGGTTPLEVVLTAKERDFWIEKPNLDRLTEIHDWLDELPETGKVISPITLLRILQQVNDNKPVPKLVIQAGLAVLPDDIKSQVVSPYITLEGNQVRIAMRVRESSHDLNRKDLLKRINAYFAEHKETDNFTARATGMFVLYNNMLQSLYQSQIVTIGSTYFTIWISFVVLFRSFSLATIGMIPNILPVLMVLGFLGWTDVPLDMMTVMIASVTLGITVDYAVFYVSRFKSEFQHDRNYVLTMYRCHNSVGMGIWYNSITIAVGFSILAASNFIPTIYFGIFTGVAMMLGLVVSMTLLPLILIVWKPLGPENKAAAVANEDVTAGPFNAA
ncbi:MAG: MMPL family transporter, partial [Candidatus Hydrogenedentota bacterium]